MNGKSSRGVAAKITRFYEDLYGRGEVSHPEFLCHFSSVFMHPVLTPNFYLGASPDGEKLDAHARRFAEVSGLARHWLHVFPHQENVEQLARLGYAKGLRCTFNLFSKPFVRPIRPLGRIELVRRIPEGRRNAYELGTARNGVNLSPSTLRLIEAVLSQARGELSYALALSAEEELLGAVTLVSAHRTTLLVNGWVEQRYRERGVMSNLFTLVSAREFDRGQETLFYWTLNPVIEAFGDETLPVQIYEKFAPR